MLEDLHEVTRRYLNCPDPVEAAVRRQRVLISDARGDMEEAAATIIATAERNLANSSVQIPPPMQRNITPNQSPAPLLAPPVILLQAPDQSHDLPQAIPDSPSEQEQDSHHRRRGISARLKSAIVSPNILRGASSKKRNLSMLQRSPAGSQHNNHSGRHATGPTSARTTGASSASSQHPLIQLIPAMSKKRKDFHDPPHTAP